MNAKLQKSCIKLCSFSRNTHVATKRKVHSCAYGGTIDRCDRWQRASRYAQETFIDHAERFSISLCQVSQIGAGAKSRGGPSHYECANCTVALNPVHCRNDLGNHRRSHRVALVWIVECECCYTIRNFK